MGEEEEMDEDEEDEDDEAAIDAFDQRFLLG